MHLQLMAIVVEEYDPGIAFFVEALGFELVEDSPSLTNDGRPKRWSSCARRARRRGCCWRAPTARTRP